MKIGEPRYGEPWDLWTSCSWRRAFDSVGKAALMPTVLSDGQPDIYPADNVARSVLCVNELAGIDFKPGEVRAILDNPLRIPEGANVTIQPPPMPESELIRHLRGQVEALQKEMYRLQDDRLRGFRLPD